MNSNLTLPCFVLLFDFFFGGGGAAGLFLVWVCRFFVLRCVAERATAT